MTQTRANGSKPEQTPEDEAAFRNYATLGQQLGAVITLLISLPLPAMLNACRRHQSTSVLMLPPGTPPEQASALSAALRNDEKLLHAALNVCAVVKAAQVGL